MMALCYNIALSLEEDFLHHVEQSAVQRRVIEQRAGRAQPAVEVHHLVVCVHIVVLSDLSDPSHHHALQDPFPYDTKQQST